MFEKIKELQKRLNELLYSSPLIVILNNQQGIRSFSVEFKKSIFIAKNNPTSCYVSEDGQDAFNQIASELGLELHWKLDRSFYVREISTEK